MMMSIFWEISVLESFVSAFRSPVTGFGERIYRAVNVLAMRVGRCAEEVELGEGLHHAGLRPRGVRKCLQNKLISRLAGKSGQFVG